MTFILETLERRQLLAGDFNAGFALPYVLDFNRSKTGLLDRDGSGTGFTWAQPNVNATEYSAGRINLKIGVGVLHLYATDDNSNTTNLNGENTLKNILTARFSASSKAFVISARLNGPFPQLTAADEQGGIMFGPDQDNYVKFVIGNNGSSKGLMFVDEQKFKTGFRRQLPSTVYSTAAITGTLDLYLVCDPTAGTVRAMYRIDSGDIIELPNKLTLTGDKKAAFFNPAGFAGVMVQNHNAGVGIEMSYEQFAIQRGVLEPTPITPPPADSGQISVPSRKIFNDVRGSTGQSVTTSITNNGTGDLHVTSIALTGTDASQFAITGVGTLPKTIAPGDSLPFTVTFAATASTSLGIKTANVAIASDDPDNATKNIRLRGLATNGQGGSNEPSLQMIMNLYEIPISVGDSNPNDYLLNNPPVQPNDEVDLQRMLKAGAGNVTIQMLAAFGVGSSTTPTTLFGYYPSGTPSDIVQLLSLQGTGTATQTVSPNVVGNTAFDPGSEVFSLYMRFPSMYPTVVQTQGGTTGYGEDSLNKSYDPNSPRKIRFYTFKDSAGNVVPNSYVFTGEDLNAAYDTQDFVGVISNVTGAQAGANIGFTNGNGAPFGNRLVFNRITNVNPTSVNVVHNVGNLIVTNSGSSTLNVSNVAVPAGWSLTAGGTSFSVAPGATKKLTLQFTASGGSLHNKLFTGDLVLTSDDPNHPTAAVQLAGFWQKDSENNEEPLLPQIVNDIMGYTTTIVGPGQQLDNGGKVQAVGDEVLSPFWLRADPSLPVSVTQINAYHTQGNASIFKWYPQGSSSRNVLFTQDGLSSQSFFPLDDTGTPSAGSFNPGTSAFALKVDGEGSDDATNVQDKPGGGYGHHVRFWPAKDRAGNLIPNTYIMGLDYSGINYDYNDNVYLVTNMKPQSANGAVPQSLMASSTIPRSSSSASSFSTTSIDALTPPICSILSRRNTPHLDQFPTRRAESPPALLATNARFDDS